MSIGIMENGQYKQLSGGVPQSVLTRITTIEGELNELKQEVGLVKDTHATTTHYGLAMLSATSDVTDANAFALSAIEKNASVDGTLANVSRKISNNLQQTKFFLLNSISWYRILYSNITCSNINSITCQCFIYMYRNYNSNNSEYHFINFSNGFDIHKFTNISSFSNNHIITKMRCGYNSTTKKFFVDIFYKLSSENETKIAMVNNIDGNLSLNTTAQKVQASSPDETYSNEFEIAGNI